MMTAKTFSRACTFLTDDVAPRALKKIGLKQSSPQGRMRSASDERSMAVPFAYAAAKQRERVAVMCHLYYVEMASQIFSALEASGLYADLFISTDSEEKANEIRNAIPWNYGRVTIRVVENRGRDIAPKLITFADVYQRYPLVLCLHAKKSGHFDFGDDWRVYLLQCLAGSPAIVGSILEIFRQCPDIGMIVPAHFHRLRKKLGGFGWGANFRTARRLGWQMDIDLSETDFLDFPTGSMFWARGAALEPLVSLRLRFADFPKEPCWIDGTLAHAIERLFLFSCERAGFKWAKVAMNGSDAISTPSDVSAFVQRHSFSLLNRQP